MVQAARSGKQKIAEGKGIENRDTALCVHVIIGIIKVTTYLPDQQIKKLVQAFREDGGIHEAMTPARINSRKQP